MYLKHFSLNVPELYYSLELKKYIKDNYNFYNINEVEKTCYLLIYNLFKRQNVKKIDQWNEKRRYLCVSLNTNTYPLNNISYTTINNSLQILHDLNIVTIKIGNRKYTKKIKKTNTWLYDLPSAKLTQVFLNPVSDWIPTTSYLNVGIALYCNKKINKSNQVVSRIKYDEEIIETPINNPSIENNLQLINSYLIKNNLSTLQYKRIYGKDIDSYGRFYNSFQRIPKELRKKICEEQNWVELDFKSCIVNVLYLIETGKFYQGDIYNDLLNEAKLPLEFRELFKKILIVSINTNSKKSAVRTIRNILVEEGMYSKYNHLEYVDYKIDYLPTIYNYCLKKYKYNLKDLYLFTPEYLLSIFEKNQVINKYLYTISSSFTQNIESNVISILMKNCIKDNIIPLSIHDCIIIPKKYEIKYSKLMLSLLKKESFYYKNKCNILSYFTQRTTTGINKLKYDSSFLNFIKDCYFKNNTIKIEKWKFEYG